MRGPEHLAYWTEHLDTGGFVYVVQTRKGTPIKVGTALDVRSRVASLQTGNPDELHLIHVVPGDARLERHFHGRLRGDKVRGEWFYGPKVGVFLSYVADLAQRMVDDHKLTGAEPDYRLHIDLPGPRPKRPVHEVKVRQAKPGELDDLVTPRDLDRYAADAQAKRGRLIRDAITNPDAA